MSSGHFTKMGAIRNRRRRVWKSAAQLRNLAVDLNVMETSNAVALTSFKSTKRTSARMAV
jgi:hypothetical protein